MNRTHLIREGITDAYAEWANVPWAEAKYPAYLMVDLEAQINATLPSRWGSLVASRLRVCAKAYALAEFESSPLLYRKDGLL